MQSICNINKKFNFISLIYDLTELFTYIQTVKYDYYVI